jgi:type IX secretion system PorP/SprF family membrane protein
MKYIRQICFCLLTICMVHFLHAQTPLSSQNMAITNYINPANVGMGLNGQLNSFYRNQFAGVGDAFNTIGVGADFKIFHYNKEEINHFGMGVQAVSERVLNGALQSNYISVGFSDRVFLNKSQSSYLALGIGGTLISRNIDREQLTFSDQYNSGRLFNSTSLENIATYPIRFSSNVGVMYGFSNPNMSLQFGGSTYFINRSSSFQIYNKVNQSFQMVGVLNFEHLIWEDHTILFHADFQDRLEATYYYAGMAMGFPIHDKQESLNRLYLGCFYRSKDAVIPYFGLMINKYKIGLSYDIYQNNLTSTNLHPQTMEISLSTYLTNFKTENLRSFF